MISIRHLEKKYGEKIILKDISLDIQKGEVFGIVGHSGAGKSTLLRCLNGLEPYESGSVKVDGLEVKELDSQGLKTLRQGMGMIFQQFSLMQRKNVFENVAFPLRIWGKSRTEIIERVMELLAMVGLADRAKSHVQSLSGGQKQRVGIARALALAPKILLCDEATSALDPRTTNSILELLEQINKELGLTIVLVTHQMEVVKRLCDRVLLLEDGEEKGLGNTDDIFLAAPTKALSNLMEDEFSLILHGTNIRMWFPKEIAQDAVITNMARELDINFSIVGGKLERYQDDVRGFLIINVGDENLDTILNYLKDKQLYWEVMTDEV